MNEKRVYGYPQVEKIHDKVFIGQGVKEVIENFGNPSFNDNGQICYIQIFGNEGSVVSFVPKGSKSTCMKIVDSKVESKVIKTSQIEERHPAGKKLSSLGKSFKLKWNHGAN